MSEQYTPSKGFVRGAYVFDRVEIGTATEDEADAEFDRWLSAHNAKVHTKALRDAADALLASPAVLISGRGGGVELLRTMAGGKA